MGVAGDAAWHLLGLGAAVDPAVGHRAGSAQLGRDSGDLLHPGTVEAHSDQADLVDGGVGGDDRKAGHEVRLRGAGADCGDGVEREIANGAFVQGANEAQPSRRSAGPVGEVGNGVPHAVEGAGEGVDAFKRIASGEVQVGGQLDVGRRSVGTITGIESLGQEL